MKKREFIWGKRGKRSRYTEEDMDLIGQMHQEGKTWGEIASHFGVTSKYLHRMAGERGIIEEGTRRQRQWRGPQPNFHDQNLELRGGI